MGPPTLHVWNQAFEALQVQGSNPIKKAGLQALVHTDCVPNSADPSSLAWWGSAALKSSMMGSPQGLPVILLF